MFTRNAECKGDHGKGRETHYMTSTGALQATGMAEATRRQACELTLLVTIMHF